MRIIKAGVAFALAMGVCVANAAGLGKLTVNSALGQPLNAEIDLVSVQPGELDSLTAKVASPEAFRDARIEYSSALRLLRFSVDKRANGQPYLKVTSAGPINEPFLDALIELSWPQGRIQREYPILLDPPGYGQGRVAPPTTAAAPTASRPAETPPATAPAASSSTPAPGAPATESAGTPSAQRELPTPPATATATAESTAGGDTYGPVQKGDTLAKIATELKPSNVSLEQMLVALYRENKSAFVNNNMNRLKAGQILKVPSAAEVEQLQAREARTEYRTHVADWKAYREQLGTTVAAAPATSASTSPTAGSGRITSAAVTPPAAPTEVPKDVLKLSKTEAKGAGKAGAGGKGGGTGTGQERLNALQEELTAKDKALQEANSRVADLEKQIRDMQRLLDLKGAAPAKTDTKVAAAPAPTKVPEPPKTEPAKPAEAPKVATATPTPPPAPTPAPATPPKAGEPAKVEPVKPAEAPKVAQATPAQPPKTDPAKPAAKTDPAKTDPAKPAPKKPAPPPKSMTDELLDNPLVFWGGLGLLALAIGGGAFAFIRKRRAQSYTGGASSTMGSAFPADLKVDNDAGKAGGGLVDTGNSSFLTDFDKTGPGTIDTDEVDPVAEAEVYIAYGRDSQAEEILKEAMARDPNRPEIALKLLEIYHARKSPTAFESVARDLHDKVGDTHPMWQKAAAMGAQIDPANPLYAGAALAGGAAVAAAAPAPAARPELDFDIAGAKTGEPAAGPDFNLDADSKAPAGSSGLDFDITPSQPAPTAAEPAKEEKPAFDFDLSGLDMPGSKGTTSSDIDLEASRPAPSAPALNLSDLSLEPAPEPAADAGGGEGVGTKLELAKAYLEIGDKDGAREILQEVAKEGSAAQKAEAEKLISQL